MITLQEMAVFNSLYLIAKAKLSIEIEIRDRTTSKFIGED